MFTDEQKAKFATFKGCRNGLMLCTIYLHLNRNFFILVSVAPLTNGSQVPTVAMSDHTWIGSLCYAYAQVHSNDVQDAFRMRSGVGTVQWG